MTDHTFAPTAVASRADPARLAIEFQHSSPLLDPAGAGLHTWQVRITADGELVGSMQATRGLFWEANDLRERMTDEGDFVAEVSHQLLGPDGSFTTEFEQFIEMPGNVLVLDRCQMQNPWDDAFTVAGVAACIINRLTDNGYAVVFPRTGARAAVGAGLLQAAGELLSAEQFSDDLLILDTSLAAPEAAAHRVSEHLADRARRGGTDLDDLDEEGWDEEYEVLTPRTAAVLRLALQQLADEAWAEVAALGDQPLPRGAGGLFGSLPPVTLRQDTAWRRQMARTFDDLAKDLEHDTVTPLCTGEEMALHLGIARAQALHQDRPRLVAQATQGREVHAQDFDWSACSDVLFEDHDVLMLFDDALDGIEDSNSEVNRALGMVNLAALDWFTPFDADRARDPARGFRHP